MSLDLRKDIKKAVADSEENHSLFYNREEFDKAMRSHKVDHPSHYNQDDEVECIAAIKAATKGLEGYEAFCTGNAIKYLWRWKRKGGKEDLEKVIWYVQYLLDHLPEAIQLLD